MLSTLEAKRTRTEKALSANGNGNGMVTQSLEVAEQVYCSQHGLVKAVWGQCIECFDQGYRDWDATRITKTLIPSWTGINVDGRQVIVTPVKDALEAVQAISRYKHSDALVLIKWGRLITALDHGRIGPSWTLQDADAADEIECVRCCQPFRPTWGDERLCDECWLAENGPRW